MNRYLTTLILSGAIGLGSLRAVETPAPPDPNIGQPAPILKVKEWVDGKGLDLASLKGRPYVVEFWATWCPPCRKSIPHLIALAQRVMPLGLPIIGLSNEDLATIKPFAEDQGMLYHVGVNDGTTGLKFEGIPFAAVVDPTGKIAWAGHPMDPQFEETVYLTLAAWRPERKIFVELARADKLGELQAALAKSPAPDATAGAAMLTGFASRQLEMSSKAPVTSAYPLLQTLAKKWEGTPTGDKAIQAIVEMKKDPVKSKQAEQWDQMQVFDKEVERLRAKAQDLAKSGKETAVVTKDFLQGVAKTMDAFIQTHPLHPAIEGLKKSLVQVKEELAKITAPATEVAPAPTPPPAPAVPAEPQPKPE